MKAASVSVPNLSGTFKKFRSLSAKGVQEWKNSVDKTTRVKRTTKKVQDNEIYGAGEDAIAFAFDGGEPIDRLHPYLESNGLTFADLDRVYKKVHKVGFTAYLAALWDDAQSDRMSDARRGHPDHNSNFYSVEDGVIVPATNPWKET